MKNIQLKSFIVIKVLLCFLLIGALFNQPYSYYEVLRWLVCGVMLYEFWKSFDERGAVEPNIIIALSICTAIVYNPIWPFYFSKFIWQMIDVFVFLFISFSILVETEWCINKTIIKPKKLK